MSKEKKLSIQTCYIFCLLKVIIIILTGMFVSCSPGIKTYTDEKREPKIEPDYSDITIPPNIAPMNFIINEEAKEYRVHLYSLSGEGIIIKSTGNRIQIPSRKWEALLTECKGTELLIDVYMKKSNGWVKFETIINQVAMEPIDSYLVYRLFDQGFEAWNKMGIYQRCLENFEVSPVMVNDMSEGNCMNCHTFNKNNSNKIGRASCRERV